MSDPSADPARLAMLRALNVEEATAFYNRTDPPMSHIRVHNADKVLVRVHKERIANSNLTDEERKISQDWIDARIARGRR